MKVLITGSSGLLGMPVAKAFVEAGHDVTGVDTVSPTSIVPWRHISADLRDLGSTLQVVRDCEAVVHIAGIPRPTGIPPATVMATNMAINYNVVEATALCGARRIVFASSMSVLGYPFYLRPIVPQYLPFDSHHPIGAQDAYGLSKWLGEEIIAAAIRRRGDLSAVSLRMPWVQNSKGFVQAVEVRRARSRLGVRDLWGYIDTRDAAMAFLASVERILEGHSRVFISATDTYMEEFTADLIEKAFPTTPLNRAFKANESIFDLTEAQELLGFKPEHSWRDY
jgi:nucleoside-diphosphate-sugar epimerase